MNEQTPVGPVTQAVRDHLQIEALQAEVKRLHALVMHLTRAHPRAGWDTATAAGQHPRSPVIKYEAKMLVPGWPLLAGRFHLSEEYFYDPACGSAPFDECVRGLHRRMVDETKARNPHWGE